MSVRVGDIRRYLDDDYANHFNIERVSDNQVFFGTYNLSVDFENEAIACVTQWGSHFGYYIARVINEEDGFRFLLRKERKARR